MNMNFPVIVINHLWDRCLDVENGGMTKDLLLLGIWNFALEKIYWYHIINLAYKICCSCIFCSKIIKRKWSSYDICWFLNDKWSSTLKIDLIDFKEKRIYKHL